MEMMGISPLPLLLSMQPDGDDGDVIVILQQMDHTTFTRKGMDLFVNKKVSLKEALCGFKFSFEHLDGRKMCLACDPGSVIAPGELHCSVPWSSHIAPGELHYCSVPWSSHM